MNTRLWFKGLAYFVATVLFTWFILLKIFARLAARRGRSAPCPASLAWLIDNPLRRRYMDPVLKWVDIQSGETILELGSGTGVFTLAAAHMAGPDGRVLAVDIQPQMIAEVQKHVRQASLRNVHTYLADAGDLPFADHSIDRAFLISVLPEIPDQSQALAELGRVLRPEGILSLTFEFTDPDYLFAGETARLLAKIGFSQVARHGTWWRYTLNFRPAEKTTWESSYYVFRHKKMLRDYDRAVRRVRPLLGQRYGEPFVVTVAPEARAEFQKLIPALPYIGGPRNPLTFNLVSTAWFLAFYRALQRHGKNIHEVGPLLHDIYRVWLDSYPRWWLRLRGWGAFIPPAQRKLIRRAQRSQEQPIPETGCLPSAPRTAMSLASTTRLARPIILGLISR